MVASFALSIISSVIVSTLFFLATEILSTKIYNDSSLILYFSLVSLGIVPAILTNNIVGMLRGLQKMKNISLVLIVGKILGFSISMVLVISYGLWGMTLGLVVFHIGSLTVSLIFFNRFIEIRKLISKFKVTLVPVNL